jgi:hypothetical protein
MTAIINSTVYVSQEDDGVPEQILVGTELSGDYAWVPDVLKKHGTYDLLTAKPKEEVDDAEGPAIGDVVEADEAKTKGHKGSR